jgi:hypothetical protein
LYRFVRHPIYTGITALVAGVTIRSASIAVALASVALVGWFMIEARWEEQHLTPALRRPRRLRGAHAPVHPVLADPPHVGVRPATLRHRRRRARR